MRTDPPPFSNIKHAYELLGVPDSSSARLIKQAYRAMAKRWHPDLYRAGTPEQAEAARMMELINEAYSTIQSAPLRYNTPDYYGGVTQSPSQASEPANEIPAITNRKPFVAPHRLEFWIRFVCGSMLGVLVSGKILLPNILIFHTPLPVMLCISIVIVLACGFGAARGGDAFWYGFFGVDR